MSAVPQPEAYGRPEAADDSAFARPLKGHSGAEVLLLGKWGVHVVRKTAASPGVNARLLGQSEKQRRLSLCGVAFPRVLTEGLDEDGRAFFEMEYVPARTVAQMVCEAMPFDEAEVLRALRRLFSLLSLTAGEGLPAALFHAKIAQIAGSDHASLRGRAPAMAALAGRLHELCWEGIPQSLDHGDLTLENMLVSQRGIVFIDCDACFASSYWLDAAKLFQDVAGHWCLRELYMSAPTGWALLNATGQLARLSRVLQALVAELDPGLARCLPQLAALHLFRTLPYSRDDRLVAFVLRRISELLSANGG